MCFYIIHFLLDKQRDGHGYSTIFWPSTEPQIRPALGLVAKRNWEASDDEDDARSKKLNRWRHTAAASKQPQASSRKQAAQQDAVLNYSSKCRPQNQGRN